MCYENTTSRHIPQASFYQITAPQPHLFAFVYSTLAGASGKELTCQCRRPKRRSFDPWVGKIPWRRAWQPTQVFVPGESHGQRNLVGYSPQGCKETDMTEGTSHAGTRSSLQGISVASFLLSLVFISCVIPPKHLWDPSVQFSHSVMFNSLRPHGLQHDRLPCPSPIPGACSNSCPLSRWCHPTISSSVFPFSSCLQSFPASGSFPKSQFFASGGQSIGVSASASVLAMNIQGWFPLGLTVSLSLQSKRLSRVFSKTTVQKHQVFGPQLSL